MVLGQGYIVVIWPHGGMFSLRAEETACGCRTREVRKSEID